MKFYMVTKVTNTFQNMIEEYIVTFVFLKNHLEANIYKILFKIALTNIEVSVSLARLHSTILKTTKKSLNFMDIPSICQNLFS